MELIKYDLKLKAKYFGMFIGNKAIAENDFVAPLIGVEYKLSEYSPYPSEVNIGMTISNLKDAKLILKLLNNLSNEDANKIFPNLSLNDFSYEFEYLDGISYGIKTTHADPKWSSVGKHIIKLSEWYHLALLGYAIPVNGIYDPFKLGWAIENDFV